MVLEINREFYSVNRFVVDFIASTRAFGEDENRRRAVAEAWKNGPAGRLKTSLQRKTVAPPKRIVSKYLYFCNEERPKVLAENPDIDIKQCTCLLGRRWREFQANPDAERMKRYEELFEADKRRYDSQRATTLSSRTKRPAPKSAYLDFCAERRAENPKISLKELAVLWAADKSSRSAVVLPVECQA